MATIHRLARFVLGFACFTLTQCNPAQAQLVASDLDEIEGYLSSINGHASGIGAILGNTRYNGWGLGRWAAEIDSKLRDVADIETATVSIGNSVAALDYHLLDISDNQLRDPVSDLGLGEMLRGVQLDMSELRFYGAFLQSWDQFGIPLDDELLQLVAQVRADGVLRWDNPMSAGTPAYYLQRINDALRGSDDSETERLAQIAGAFIGEQFSEAGPYDVTWFKSGQTAMRSELELIRSNSVEANSILNDIYAILDDMNQGGELSGLGVTTDLPGDAATAAPIPGTYDQDFDDNASEWRELFYDDEGGDLFAYDGPGTSSDDIASGPMQDDQSDAPSFNWTIPTSNIDVAGFTPTDWNIDIDLAPLEPIRTHIRAGFLIIGGIGAFFIVSGAYS